MSAFINVSLQGVCTVIAGQSPPSTSYNDKKEGLPFFQGKADFGALNPKVRMWCSKPKKVSEPNDILMSVRAPVGPTNINNVRACIGRGLSAIRCLDRIERNFLLHYLRYNEHKIADKGTGSTFKAITQKELKALQIPLPPLEEQKKIAAILDAADALRQKDAQLIDKYNDLSQSLFLDMFGDPVTNPMGWKLRSVGTLLKGKSQNGLYLTKDKYQQSGIEMVHMSDAFYGVVSPGRLKKVILTDLELEKYRLSENDLLLARRSLTYEGAAKACLIPKHDEPLVYESSLIRVSPNAELINTLYLFYFFSNERARGKHVNKYISRSTISGINNKGLNAIEVILPPVALQNQFAERIQRIEAQKQQAQAALQKSEDLFNSLLQRAFKGELTQESEVSHA